MSTHPIVSRNEWLAARKTLLKQEKDFTRQRDALSAERRKLPWVKVEKSYAFEGPGGKETLADLFAGKSQLAVYHFMLGPDWPEGCKSCSFWADNFDGVDVHLRHRDLTLIAISRAPLATIEAFKRRMGWRFKWVSSSGNDFNRDFNVSFTPEEHANGGAPYNFDTRKFTGDEAPGMSLFARDDAGAVFHTYSTYSRGLDMINGAYHILDLAPKGRDEAALPYTMAWVRHHDKYED
jgi:predicted dithiol-disulfide oxidoreductase (DUF899 family)